MLTEIGVATVVPWAAARCVAVWRARRARLRRLFDDAFGAEGVEVEGHGNLLTASAYLHGLAAEELSPGQLTAAERQRSSHLRDTKYCSEAWTWHR